MLGEFCPRCRYSKILKYHPEAVLELGADCQTGYLNGREPISAAEAELVNAACQVAFGNT